MESSGSYQWHIRDPDLINKILSANCGDEFKSDVFDIGKLNWVIEIDPNGLNEKNRGYCAVLVRLLRIPSSWASIFCQLDIECPEIKSKLIISASYNKAAGFGNFLSSFAEFRASHNRQWTLNITIRIIRITLKKKHTILFQIPTPKYQMSARFQWNIDCQWMEQLKSYQKPKGIYSHIFHDIWCLTLYPNGAWNSKGGDVRMGLRLCALPPNVSKMNVRWTVHYHEANITQTFTNDFDDDNLWQWSLKPNSISFAEFKKYDTWSTRMIINVLHEWDADGNDATDKAWCEYKDNQNKLELHGAAIQSLSKNNEQIQRTLQKMEQRISYLEEEKFNLKAVWKDISVLKQKVEMILSTNSQQKTKENPRREMVRNWFNNEVHLGQYYDVFIANGFEDLGVIKSLNMKLLNMMGIDKFGHQIKILQCVAKLNNNETSQSIEGTQGTTAYI